MRTGLVSSAVILALLAGGCIVGPGASQTKLVEFDVDVVAITAEAVTFSPHLWTHEEFAELEPPAQWIAAGFAVIEGKSEAANSSWRFNEMSGIDWRSQIEVSVGSPELVVRFWMDTYSFEYEWETTPLPVAANSDFREFRISKNGDSVSVQEVWPTPQRVHISFTPLDDQRASLEVQAAYPAPAGMHVHPHPAAEPALMDRWMTIDLNESNQWVLTFERSMLPGSLLSVQVEPSGLLSIGTFVLTCNWDDQATAVADAVCTPAHTQESARSVRTTSPTEVATENVASERP